MTEVERVSEDEGAGPFTWFAVAGAIGAIWAIIMGMEYYNIPTFTAGALPTIAGVAIAVCVFFLVGWRAPPNE